MKYVIRTIGVLVALLLISAVIFGLWRAAQQSQVEESRLMIDQEGVDELFDAEIGGIRQAFHARGVDRDAPVLLWLHGGPGTPMMPFGHLFQAPLESHFIVVHWDQRGVGKTYNMNPEFDLGSIDYDRMVTDAIEVITLLKSRYNKDQVVLVGHSWGSMLAMGLLSRAGSDVSVYVGTGQVVDVNQNETLGYRAALDEARRLQHQEAIAALEALKPYPEPDGSVRDDEISVLRYWQNIFGFAISRTKRDNIVMYMVQEALRSPEYTLSDISYLLKDTAALWPRLDYEVDRFNAEEHITEFGVPVFLFLGRYDWQTPSTLAAEWLETVSAPSKHIVWFEQSAHAPVIDEPDKFADQMIELVLPIAQSAFQ